MKNLMKKTIGLLTVILTTSAILTSTTSNAQDFGADVVSSYMIQDLNLAKKLYKHLRSLELLEFILKIKFHKKDVVI